MKNLYRKDNSMPVYRRRRAPGRPRRRRANLKRIVRSQIQRYAETKETSLFNDYQVAIPTGGYMYNLSSIAQGTGNAYRVGNSCHLTKICGRLLFTMDTNAAVKMSAAVRCIFLQARGRELFTGDMPNYWAPCDLDKMVVLRDYLFTVSNTAYSSTPTGERLGTTMVRKNIKLTKFRNSILHFDDTGTVNYNGAIYMYIIAESGALISGYLKTYFKDV